MSGALVRGLLLFAQQEQIPQGPLLAVLDRPAPALSDPEHRVPSALYGELLDRCVAAAATPGFAVRLGAATRVAHLGLLGVVLQACASLGEALAAYARWQRVLGESLQLSLSVRGRAACVQLIPQDRHAGAAARTVSMLAGIHGVCTELLGRPAPWQRLALDPGLLASAGVAPLQRLLAVAPQAGDNSLWLDAEALRWPIQHGLADPALLAVLQQRLGERESALAAASTAQRVEAWLCRHLAQCARLQLADAARALHLSPRALQHRLQQEGLAYRRLSDRVSEQAARGWLAQGQRVAEVAHALGYADERAFSRAFRRWTGNTPAGLARSDR